jgi:integrase
VRRRVRLAEERGDMPTHTQVARTGRSVWRDAGAVKETTIRVEFMSITKRIGLGHLTCPKDLRHLFATSLQAAGVGPLIRWDIMGHTSLDMTGHYTHIQNTTRQRELTRLAEVRGGALQMVGGRC